MKIKKIILVVLFSILTLGNNQHSSIHAEKEVVEETIHEYVPQIKRSSVSKDESTIQRDAELYLQKKYGTTEWTEGKHNTTETVSNAIPIEMQMTNKYKDTVIQAICKELGLKSTYGGCGPIAMIGMADFFARYLGYTEIIQNPDDLEQQKELIREFLNIIPTSEIKDNDPQGTGKQTLALPWDCESGFNKIMKKHNLENTIHATDMGFLFVFKNEKIAKIKEQVDKGLPVTLYTALAGDGKLGNHYVNVYGYSDWTGKDQNGKTITHTMLQFRMNWGESYDDTLYMDSDILGSFFTGIIYYDITYKYQVLPDMFFQGFKNEQNQGQYFNEVVERPLSISEPLVKMSFMTRRLRCSYLNQGYLVLSANRDNHDTAYLEFEFEEDIRQVGLNLWKWSENERFGADASLRLEYFDKNTNRWEIAKDIDISTLPLKENMPKAILTILPKATNKIKIIVENEGITTDRNKGRIVIESVDAYFDTYNQFYMPHEHKFDKRFVYNDKSTHWAYCECGIGTMQQHIIIEGIDECIACGGEVPSHEHIWNLEGYNDNYHKLYCNCGATQEQNHTTIIEDGIEKCQYCDYTHAHQYLCESYNDIQHKMYCGCGDFYLENHALFEENNIVKCQYCDYSHTHQYLCEQYNDTKHKKYCECGDFYLENHNMTEASHAHSTIICLDCGMSQDSGHIFTKRYGNKDMMEHVAYCECGESITEEHEFTDYFINDENYHELFCRCGNSLMYEHTFDHRYELKDDNTHIAYCECGATQEQNHTTIIEDGIEKCQYCNYEKEHIHQYTYEEYDEVKHEVYCECGENYREAHVIDNPATGHFTIKCNYCDARIDIGCIYKDHYAYYSENEHLAYCICGDVILKEHTYNEDGTCIYCNG